MSPNWPQDAYKLAVNPRRVPLWVRLTTLWAGWLTQIGTLVFLFGMIMLSLSAPQSELPWVLEFRGPLETASGVIVSQRETNASVNDVSIYAYTYQFSGPDQAVYQGTSYITGEYAKPGQSVVVEFPKGKPAISRIRGMRRAMFSAWPPALVGLLSLAGLCMLAPGLRRGWRNGQLLGRGILTTGVLTSKESTCARVNDRVVYRMRFQFTTEGGQTCQVAARTHRPELLEDQSAEPLLYHPRNPSRAVMLDSLPSQPTITEDGAVAPTRRAALSLLILPTLALLATVIVVAYAMRS